MLFHVARTGCFEFISYTVTPQTMQFPANAHASERSLSLGWDFSGSAHVTAHRAAVYKEFACLFSCGLL